MRGGLCFSGWVRRWIIRHRKELTAVWRRGYGLELASLGGTVFSWKGYWSLDEAGAPPRAGRPGGIAPGRPRLPGRCLPDHPAGAGAGLVTPRVASRRAWPRATANLGPRGRGRGSGARELGGIPECGAGRLPPGGPRRPLPGPRGRGQPPFSGHTRPPRTSPRPRPRPACGQGRTCARAWAAARSPSLSNHNDTPAPGAGTRAPARRGQDSEGPGRHATPLRLSSQAPRVLGETRPPNLDS